MVRNIPLFLYTNLYSHSFANKGIFATHLHELLKLPLVLRHATYGRMGLRFDASGLDIIKNTHKSKFFGQIFVIGRVHWTYLLEEGVCTDSMAIHTAKAFKLPNTLIERSLKHHFIIYYSLSNRNDQFLNL